MQGITAEQRTEEKENMKEKKHPQKHALLPSLDIESEKSLGTGGVNEQNSKTRIADMTSKDLSIYTLPSSS